MGLSDRRQRGLALPRQSAVFLLFRPGAAARCIWRQPARSPLAPDTILALPECEAGPA